MAYPSVLTDGSWQDRAFVTIIRKDTEEEIDIHGATDDMGWADGMKDFDGVPTANGGRVRERQAQDDSTFNATLWQVGAATDEYESLDRPRGVEEMFYESGDLTPEKNSVSTFGNSLVREDYIVVVLWTNDPSVSSATDAVSGAEYTAHRRIADQVNWIDAVPEWDNEVLKLELEGKWTPFDTQGRLNFILQDYTGDAEESLEPVTVQYVEGLKDSA